jgi:hypothetical protein
MLVGDFLERVASGSELHAADLLPLELRHHLLIHFQKLCGAPGRRGLASKQSRTRGCVILR